MMTVFLYVVIWYLVCLAICLRNDKKYVEGKYPGNFFKTYLKWGWAIVPLWFTAKTIAFFKRPSSKG